MTNPSDEKPGAIARNYTTFQPSGFLSPVRSNAAGTRIELLAKDPDIDIAPDGFAVPPAELRLYGEGPEGHFQQGLVQANMIRDILAKNQLDIAQMPRVMEFGCANSRVLRHFAPEARLDGHHYFGADINANTVLWSMTYLSPPFHFLANTTAPHLPFEDQNLDFIYAMSILTHIDAISFAWLYEFARVLKPGAHALVTIIDHESCDVMESKMGLSNRKDLEDSDPLALFKQLENREINMLSLSPNKVGGLTFFSIPFLLDKISHLFELVDRQFGFMTSQHGLLLRRR